MQNNLYFITFYRLLHMDVFKNTTNINELGVLLHAQNNLENTLTTKERDAYNYGASNY
jgi:hypothetical protein